MELKIKLRNERLLAIFKLAAVKQEIQIEPLQAVVAEAAARVVKCDNAIFHQIICLAGFFFCRSKISPLLELSSPKYLLAETKYEFSILSTWCCS